MTATVLDRLARRSTLTADCWLWDGARNSTGYGCIAIGGRSQLVHRVSYLEHKGPIPDGLVVDHLCHNSDQTCLGGPTCEHRRCWRPEHLEAVSSGVNTARSPLTGTHRTHCPRGHVYDAHNTRVHNGRRCCKRCGREASAKASAKTLAASDGHPPDLDGWEVELPAGLPLRGLPCGEHGMVPRLPGAEADRPVPRACTGAFCS